MDLESNVTHARFTGAKCDRVVAFDAAKANQEITGFVVYESCSIGGGDATIETTKKGMRRRQKTNEPKNAYGVTRSSQMDMRKCVVSMKKLSVALNCAKVVIALASATEMCAEKGEEGDEKTTS